MKNQPNRNYQSNDVVFTPEDMAIQIVEHFKPIGTVLEPCKGSGSFLKAFDKAGNGILYHKWAEITEGIDFLNNPITENFDWIITNPPWSKVRSFLIQSMKVADNIVFLISVNHIWTKARLRDLKQYNFGIKEILLLNTPDNFIKSGFQLGAVHLAKDYSGPIKITDLT